MGKIVKPAACGTHESSDVFIMLEPGDEGLDIQIESVVMKQFGDEILAVTKDVLRKILAYEGEVFGASAVECGNYANLDLAAAKKECAAYLEVLETKVNDFKYL